MFEITTEALVIDRENLGEQDARIFLYTKNLGGVAARATSVRRLTSKLSPHLEPLNFVTVRLVQKSGRAEDEGAGQAFFQISDALLDSRSLAWRQNPGVLAEALNLTRIFKESGLRGEADIDLWRILTKMFNEPPRLSFKLYAVQILKAMGFNPLLAHCALCAERPELFSFDDLAFYCPACCPEGSLLQNHFWRV